MLYLQNLLYRIIQYLSQYAVDNDQYIILKEKNLRQKYYLIKNKFDPKEYSKELDEENNNNVIMVSKKPKDTYGIKEFEELGYDVVNIVQDGPPLVFPKEPV